MRRIPSIVRWLIRENLKAQPDDPTIIPFFFNLLINRPEGFSIQGER
jgi:hypothetical protein